MNQRQFEPKEIELRIGGMEPFDMLVQREMRDIVDSLSMLSPTTLELSRNQPKMGATSKDGDASTLIAALQIIIPTATAARVFTTWLREYFRSRSARVLQIVDKDGRAITLRAFDLKEIEKLLGDIGPTDKSIE